MKPGLLLKDSPEPISCFWCPGEDCNGVFYDVHELKKHAKEQHQLVHEYYVEPEQDVYYEYIKKTEHYNAYLTKGWIKIEKSQGLMSCPLEFPHRPVQRFGASEQQLKNRATKNTCHCGNKFKWPRRSYCSDECSTEWNFNLTSYWDGHKHHFLHKQETKQINHRYYWACENCGNHTLEPEVDHIIAIILGGHPWDYRNLQVLCEEYHKIKTKSDVAILAEYKRQAKYDIGPIIPDPQTTLDNVFEFNYAYS